MKKKEEKLGEVLQEINTELLGDLASPAVGLLSEIKKVVHLDREYKKYHKKSTAWWMRVE